MGRSIICGVDGSADSEVALKTVAQLSDRLGLKLVVAHVAEAAFIPYAAAAPFGGMAGRDAVVAEVDSQEKSAERLLEQVVLKAGLVGIERRASVGQPAERLADLAGLRPRTSSRWCRRPSFSCSRPSSATRATSSAR